MTAKEALKQLKALGNESVRARNARNGAGDNQFGAKLGDIRALAEKIGPGHELALALWDTGNVDAQLLATLLIKPKSLSSEEIDRDYPVSKGCTSPFAPIWIDAIVNRRTKR